MFQKQRKVGDGGGSPNMPGYDPAGGREAKDAVAKAKAMMSKLDGSIKSSQNEEKAQKKKEEWTGRGCVC
jgi:hypothetical protein